MFQKTIVEKYLSKLNSELLHQKYELFCSIYRNEKKIENIRNLKEEQYQEGFIRDIFVSVLGYTIKPEENYNILTELKNEVVNKSNSKKSDGAICEENNENKVRAVIELKGTDTTDLDKVAFQAFSYKNFHNECNYVIVSNFERLRLYVETQIEFEEFNLFTLTYEQFCILYLLLELNNLKADVPLKLKHETLSEEKQITDNFYADYSNFKRLLFEDLCENNLSNEAVVEPVETTGTGHFDKLNDRKINKLLLFKKTQKLLDRILFIMFCEDRNLLPPNSIAGILKRWEAARENFLEVPLYNLFKQYFNWIDKGFENPNDKNASIFAYNGGLFKTDEVLDSIKVGDDVLFIHTKRLADYDFESQISVDILGRIFENSLTEIEEVQKEIEAEKEKRRVVEPFDRLRIPPVETTKFNNVGKRKKDGVFYTPEYITKYIVENTIGKLCQEKRNELNISDEEFSPDKSVKSGDDKKTVSAKKNVTDELDKRLESYRAWLLDLKILDPACGSGAFLNAALQQLKIEHTLIDYYWSNIHAGELNFTEIENTILENNLYGVDINEESVEIAKLSLWLHTAKKNRKLTTLNGKIKCGNSLIDDPEVAGEKAFNWEKEFPEVFRGNSRDKGLKSLVQSVLSTVNDIEKGDVIYHVTTATHNSRYSAKTLYFNDGEMGEPVNLDFDEEVFVMQTIAKIIEENKYKVLAYNFCKDHLHFLVACKKEELPKIMQKIKGITSLERNRKFNPTDRQLWQQKYFEKVVYNDEYLANTIHYILNNRKKHGLKEFTDDNGNSRDKGDSDNGKGLKSLEKGVNKHGFDVIIGNPPYVQLQTMGEMSDVYAKCGYESYNKSADLYCLFTERGYKLLKQDGLQSFIMPNKWMLVDYGKELRKFMSQTSLQQIINFGDVQFFHDATTYVCIFVTKKAEEKNKVLALSLNKKTYKGNFLNEVKNGLEEFESEIFTDEPWIINSQKESKILAKMKCGNVLKDLPIDIISGIKTGFNDAFYIDEETRTKLIAEDSKSNELIRPLLCGRDISAWYSKNEFYMINTHNGLKEKNLPPVDVEKYPAIKKHLDQFYEKLSKRGDKGVTPYNLRNCAYLNEFDKPKIIYANMTSQFPFCYDESGTLTNQKCFMILTKDEMFSLKELTAILNSKLCKLWIWYNCPELQGGTRELSKIYFENFPIPDLTDPQFSIFNSQLSICSDKMLSLNETLQKKSGNFIKVVKQSFALEKVSAKMESFYELDFDGFVKELKQKVTPKIKLEWLEVFEDTKKELLDLKQQIDSTDKEINQLVYQLYGLTDEEIAVVEVSH